MAVIRSPSIALLVLGFAILVPTRGWSHAGAIPQTIDVFSRPGDDVALGLETTFGLLLAASGDEFRWLCHEAITGDLVFLTPEYVQNQDGVMLGFTGVLSDAMADVGESLYRSEEGCQWGPGDGLTGKVVSSAAFDPSDGMVALAVLGATGMDAGNGIWRSQDAGATWSDTGVDGSGRLFRDVLFASGSVAWATAVWFEPLGSWIYRTLDGGMTWQSHPLDFESGGRVQTVVDVAAAAADGQTVWLRVASASNGFLLRSVDGGETFEEVFSVEGVIRDAVLDSDGVLWLVTDQGALFRSEDGVAFVGLEGAPRALGVDADVRGLQIAVDTQFHKFALALSQDGEHFSPLLGFDATVGPLACEAGSDAAELCDPLWPTVAAQLGQGEYPDDGAPWDDLDPADEDWDSGCQCSTQGGSASGLAQRAAAGSAEWVAISATLLILVSRRRWAD